MIVCRAAEKDTSITGVDAAGCCSAAVELSIEDKGKISARLAVAMDMTIMLSLKAAESTGVVAMDGAGVNSKTSVVTIGVGFVETSSSGNSDSKKSLAVCVDATVDESPCSAVLSSKVVMTADKDCVTMGTLSDSNTSVDDTVSRSVSSDCKLSDDVIVWKDDITSRVVLTSRTGVMMIVAEDGAAVTSVISDEIGASSVGCELMSTKNEVSTASNSSEVVCKRTSDKISVISSSNIELGMSVIDDSSKTAVSSTSDTKSVRTKSGESTSCIEAKENASAEESEIV